MKITLKNICMLVVMAITVIIMTSCTDNGQKKIKTTIQGSFPGFPMKRVILSEFDINSAIPLDTATTDAGGSFTFRFARKGPGFYLIKIDNRNYITLSLNEEKAVEVYSPSNNIKKNYSVRGSDESEALRVFESGLETRRSVIDSLTRIYRNYQRSASFSSLKTDLDDSYSKVFEDQRQNSIEFIQNNCHSLVSLLVINKRFGERKIISEEKDFEVYQMLDSCLSLKYPENKFVKELKKQVDLVTTDRRIREMTEKRLDVGQKIPDIGLQDPTGKNISLYAQAGKPVLIYFWASWDKASRKANKSIKEMTGKKDGRRATVYAIGFESHMKEWQQAIENDGLQSWINVSDMLNIHSVAKTMYDVPDELPYFILVDQDLLIRFKGKDISQLQKAFEDLVN